MLHINNSEEFKSILCSKISNNQECPPLNSLGEPLNSNAIGTILVLPNVGSVNISNPVQSSTFNNNINYVIRFSIHPIPRSHSCALANGLLPRWKPHPLTNLTVFCSLSQIVVSFLLLKKSIFTLKKISSGKRKSRSHLCASSGF